jgi:hypothetical protein
MKLTDKEAEFINKRESLIKVWPAVGALILLGIFVYIGWCWWKTPYLISPVAVMEGIQTGGMEKSTVETSAVMLPIVMIMLWSLLAICVGFSFSIVGTERKHVTIIRRLTDEQTN